MSEITPEEIIIVQRNINITSYITNVPALIAWIFVLARILVFKTNLWGLVLICCLMIIA
jgi:hypothetical protein